MKKILLLSPSLSSMNLGDGIITSSAKKQLDFLLNENFVTEVSTHLPTSLYYMRYLKNSDYKFVLGSNLLKSTFFGFKRQWDVKIWQSIYMKPIILVGVGWWQYGNTPNLYTKILLKSLLSDNFNHSVRDSYTEKMLKKIGIKNVINTACPTMWGLTPEHCAQIPRQKSDSVVFTLTDYNKKQKEDRKIIEILNKNYRKLYFWPQGIGDFEYIKELQVFFDFKINILDPNINSFDYLLENSDVDYIGTRLHGGIRALQKKKKTLILGIDNRAEEKKVSFNLPVVRRENYNDIELFIKGNEETKILLPLENIALWKKQFS